MSISNKHIMFIYIPFSPNEEHLWMWAGVEELHVCWTAEGCDITRCKFAYLVSSHFSSQVKLSFIVIPLHVWTYSGTRCRASQDHGAT